jgi:hypothetical protein
MPDTTYGPDASTSRVLTFTAAEELGAYELLARLSRHMSTGPIDPRERDSAFHLEHAALISGVLFWWDRWLPISIHEAARAGATLADIAVATGRSPDEVRAAWLWWVQSQRHLFATTGTIGVPDEEYETVARRLGVRPDAARGADASG